MSEPHESFVPETSSHYTLSLDLPTSITVCIILMFLISLLCQGLSRFFHWRWPDTRPASYDLEQGDGIRRPDTVSNTSQQAAFYQAIIQNNIRTLETLDSFMRDVGEKRGQRLRASEKLPPLVRYGSHEMMSSCTCSDCAICLEDFADGDKCQVFPTCNHIFHSNCIDVWLKKKLTCPICRNILDV
ncbi:putative RING-H2 finger protein ATL19 [Corylus avellana]|uniref:putative RING-H2 finger protein ATL19 n=1 Tax=Corylus avellana TaxID=13451 RepID=UPI00286A7FE7|nr:putative RING-H2 finger protein ATL19 [Corylus avellana]